MTIKHNKELKLEITKVNYEILNTEFQFIIGLNQLNEPSIQVNFENDIIIFNAIDNGSYSKTANINKLDLFTGILGYYYREHSKSINNLVTNYMELNNLK